MIEGLLLFYDDTFSAFGIERLHSNSSRERLYAPVITHPHGLSNSLMHQIENSLNKIFEICKHWSDRMLGKKQAFHG